MSIHDVHAVRLKLESYARTKVASILQPMTEEMLVEQPLDPVAFMIRSFCTESASTCRHVLKLMGSLVCRYLVSNRSDLRTIVGEEVLKVCKAEVYIQKSWGFIASSTGL